MISCINSGQYTSVPFSMKKCSKNSRLMVSSQNKIHMERQASLNKHLETLNMELPLIVNQQFSLI